jgi:type II secretory pathway pseudopilin PulG
MTRLQPREAGFTYLGLLFAIAILGITLATVGVVWSTQIRRDREAELLFVGDQYRQAIGRYYDSGGVYPRSLNDLLEDKRVPVPRRFLRRLYPDPMTGSSDWELINTGDGGIIGVASTSMATPIKVAGFPLADTAFEKADCYCAWKFIYMSKAIGRRRVLTPLPPNPLNPGQQ